MFTNLAKVDTSFATDWLYVRKPRSEIPLTPSDKIPTQPYTNTEANLTFLTLLTHSLYNYKSINLADSNCNTCAKSVN